MGYYGALSMGCQRCRSRKVKCDGRKPKCWTCEKSNFACPGYRDLNEVRFRDESPRIVRKVQKRQQQREEKAAQMQASAVIRGSLGATDRSLEDSPLTLYSPSANIDEAEINFYMHNYAFHETWRSDEYELWLRETITGQDEISQGLRAAVGATGCAGLANINLSPSTATRARQLYGQALNAVNKALQDNLTVVSDTLLLTVIVLGMHEIVTYSITGNSKGWESHVNGAATLLELRGPTQFKNKRGAQIFFQIRAQILSACLQHSLMVPQSLIALNEVFSSSLICRQMRMQNVASHRSIFALSAEAVNLVSALQRNEPGILEGATRIDGQLGEWILAVHDGWYYKILAAPDSPFKVEHVYPTPWIAQIWNSCRMLRVVLNQLIADITPDPGQRLTSTACLQQCSKDICIASKFTNSENALGCFRPLYVSATAQRNTKQVREFAARQLYQIAKITGLQQAKQAADNTMSSTKTTNKYASTKDDFFKGWILPF